MKKKQAVLDIVASPLKLREHFGELARFNIVGRQVVQLRCPKCHTSVEFFGPEGMERTPIIRCACPGGVLWRYRKRKEPGI